MEPTTAVANDELKINDTTAEPADITEVTEEGQKEETITSKAHITDIFAWANNLFMYKDQLQLDVFLMSKNNAVYSVDVGSTLGREIHGLFLDKIIEHITTGAGEGMVIRGFEEAESEDNVLQYTKAQHVEKLMDTLAWLTPGGEQEVEPFDEEEHDMKRMRGIILRASHPEVTPFYVIKALSPAQVAKGVGAWMIDTSSFEPIQPGAAVRIPADNQLLLVDDDLFVFNQGKLERLFGYNAKKNAIAEKKVAEIERRFKLSFPEELDMQTLVKGNKALINKLQKIDTETLTQEQLVDHAEELGLELMSDDSGAILITDAKDMATFVNLLNDDYVESQLTGLRYEIRSKRILQPSQE